MRRPTWRQEAEALGIEFIQPEVEKSLDDVGRGVDSETLEHHLNDAISHCAERQVAFKPELMEQFVLSQAFPTDVSLVEQGIVSHPDLIKVAAFNRNRYTTQQAVQREMATIRLMRKGKQKVRRLLSQEAIEASVSGANFTEGQKQALELSLSTSDQFIAWQGVAGEHPPPPAPARPQPAARSHHFSLSWPELRTEVHPEAEQNTWIW